MFPFVTRTKTQIETVALFDFEVGQTDRLSLGLQKVRQREREKENNKIERHKVENELIIHDNSIEGRESPCRERTTKQ